MTLLFRHKRSSMAGSSMLPHSVIGFFIVLGVVAVVLAVGLGIYVRMYATPTTPSVSTPLSEGPVVPITQSAGVFTSAFGTYRQAKVEVTPNVPTYTVASDLSNVVNVKDYDVNGIPAGDKALLVKNGFIVRAPSYANEFFSVYEPNRYTYVPSFVTADSLLHNYHLVFDYVLRKTEETKLSDVLSQLTGDMMKSTGEQYTALKNTDWENAAKRNLGFFGVAGKLIAIKNAGSTLPHNVRTAITQELDLIAAHKGIAESPVMNMGSTSGTVRDTPQGSLSLDALKEDYSQYIPRGHYDKTDQLKEYFKTMMWYGRLTFRLKNEDEIKSALLITLALNNIENQKNWNAVYEPTNFFVGKSDDITYYQLKDVVAKVYGAHATLKTVMNDTTKFVAFVDEVKKLDPPKINSMPIFNANIQPDREKEIKGFRFMGQRFTVDADIFQRLITREVGPADQSCASAPFGDGRMLPKGLDIPAAMGSQEAFNILKEEGDTNLACYSENMSKLQTYLFGLPTETWTQNLYWGWIYTLRALVGERGAGYPSFMMNSAWARKGVQTFLGSWTELKHDTILYAKQVYAELGGGPGPEQKDDRGYVEPNPVMYARLASILAMTRDGLSARGLLSDAIKKDLDTMEQLAASFKTMSEKELRNETLSDDEYELIRSYGGQLEHFWLEVNKEDMDAAKMDQNNYLDQNPSALVADVATDPNGVVLEEATGHVAEMWVIVPVAGTLRLAKGAVYTYYEFSHPLSDRLTDKAWRELLNSPDAPPMPTWTQSFVSP